MDAKDWGQRNKSARMEGATIRADYLQEEVRRQYKSSAVSGKRQNRDLRCRWCAAQGNLASTIFAKPRHSVDHSLEQISSHESACLGSVKNHRKSAIWNKS
jgi:hypothetical protein